MSKAKFDANQINNFKSALTAYKSKLAEIISAKCNFDPTDNLAITQVTNDPKQPVKYTAVNTTLLNKYTAATIPYTSLIVTPQTNAALATLDTQIAEIKSKLNEQEIKFKNPQGQELLRQLRREEKNIQVLLGNLRVCAEKTNDISFLNDLKGRVSNSQYARSVNEVIDNAIKTIQDARREGLYPDFDSKYYLLFTNWSDVYQFGIVGQAPTVEDYRSHLSNWVKLRKNIEILNKIYNSSIPTNDIDRAPFFNDQAEFQPGPYVEAIVVLRAKYAAYRAELDKHPYLKERDMNQLKRTLASSASPVENKVCASSAVGDILTFNANDAAYKLELTRQLADFNRQRNELTRGNRQATSAIDATQMFIPINAASTTPIQINDDTQFEDYDTMRIHINDIIEQIDTILAIITNTDFANKFHAQTDIQTVTDEINTLISRITNIPQVKCDIPDDVDRIRSLHRKASEFGIVAQSTTLPYDPTANDANAITTAMNNRKRQFATVSKPNDRFVGVSLGTARDYSSQLTNGSALLHGLAGGKLVNVVVEVVPDAERQGAQPVNRTIEVIDFDIDLPQNSALKTLVDDFDATSASADSLPSFTVKVAEYLAKLRTDLGSDELFETLTSVINSGNGAAFAKALFQKSNQDIFITPLLTDATVTNLTTGLPVNVTSTDWREIYHVAYKASEVYKSRLEQESASPVSSQKGGALDANTNNDIAAFTRYLINNINLQPVITDIKNRLLLLNHFAGSPTKLNATIDLKQKEWRDMATASNVDIAVKNTWKQVENKLRGNIKRIKSNWSRMGDGPMVHNPEANQPVNNGKPQDAFNCNLMHDTKYCIDLIDNCLLSSTANDFTSGPCNLDYDKFINVNDLTPEELKARVSQINPFFAVSFLAKLHFGYKREHDPRGFFFYKIQSVEAWIKELLDTTRARQCNEYTKYSKCDVSLHDALGAKNAQAIINLMKTDPAKASIFFNFLDIMVEWANMNPQAISPELRKKPSMHGDVTAKYPPQTERYNIYTHISPEQQKFIKNRMRLCELERLRSLLSEKATGADASQGVRLTEIMNNRMPLMPFNVSNPAFSNMSYAIPSNALGYSSMMGSTLGNLGIGNMGNMGYGSNLGYGMLGGAVNSSQLGGYWDNSNSSTFSIPSSTIMFETPTSDINSILDNSVIGNDILNAFFYQLSNDKDTNYNRSLTSTTSTRIKELMQKYQDMEEDIKKDFKEFMSRYLLEQRTNGWVDAFNIPSSVFDEIERKQTGKPLRSRIDSYNKYTSVLFGNFLEIFKNIFDKEGTRSLSPYQRPLDINY
ncbi:Hypothetical protein MVR_LOCUS234 [uncultured virus]|nr:Hypothetical protein MVR_LOCUS234 [uncultured virus]